jgi:hypothetical protein
MQWQVTIELLLKARWKWWCRHRIKNWFMNSYMIYTKNKRTIVTKTGDIILMFTLYSGIAEREHKVPERYKYLLRENFDRCIDKMLFTIRPDEQKKEEG